MNMLRALLRILGPIGIVAVGLLLACVSFYFSAVAPAESELAAQQSAAQRVKSRAPQQAVAADNKSEDLRRFHSQFPPSTQIPNEIEKLWAVATEYQIELQKGEYRLESNGPGLLRYRVILPLSVSYPRLRQLVDFILKELPTVAIDALRFERKKIGDTQLDVQIALTFYFRPGTQAPTPRQSP